MFSAAAAHRPDEDTETTQRYLIGSRVVHRDHGYRGTIRYTGMVEWSAAQQSPLMRFVLGVEWDGPHGKNDGCLEDGRRLFTCAAAHGSFVAPTKVCLGASLDTVLAARYSEASEAMGVRQLGSRTPSVRDPTTGSYVNVVNVDCAATPDLLSASGASPALGTLFPNIRRLSVANCLFDSWDAIADVCRQLPALQTLNINHCKLGHVRASAVAVADRPLSTSLEVLSCGDTGIADPCVPYVLAAFPNIRELHLDGNSLRHFDAAGARQLLTGDGGHRLELVSLAKTQFSSLGDVAQSLGPELRTRLEALVLSGAPLADITAVDQFPRLVRLVMRDVALKKWDDLVPIHDRAPQLRHLCFSSPSLDGMFDCAVERRRHVVGMMPKHVTHLNQSFIRESEWSSSRQALMTHYVRLKQSGQLQSEEDIPQLVKQLIEEQTAAGVQVFVPKPKLLELTIRVRLHLLLGAPPDLRRERESQFPSLHLSTLEDIHVSPSPAAVTTLAAAALVYAVLDDFEFRVRQTVGKLKAFVKAYLASPTISDKHRYSLEAAATVAGLTLPQLVDAVHAASEAELYQLDAELMQNPGAVAKGFHCKALTPDRPPLHNWRFQCGDHLVVLVPRVDIAGH